MQEQYDDAAFDRAFAQATDEVAAEQAHMEVDEQRLEADEPMETLISADDRYTSIDNWDMATTEEAEAEQHTQQEEDDALAATADELLQKVENNQTDKFRNSQFLGLMRKLRDRQVKVDGDKMVEVDTSVSTTQPDLKRPISTPDSTYASGPSTPALVDQAYPHPMFTGRNPFTFEEDYSSHAYDHWESPYS